MATEKKCAVCGTIFSGRRSRFCSSECQKKYRLRIEKRRKNWDENKEIGRLVNQVRSLSRRLYDFIGFPPLESGVEMHHGYGILSLDLGGFFQFTTKEHALIHSKVPELDVDMVSYLTILRLKPELRAELKEEYLRMVEDGSLSALLQQFPVYKVLSKYKVVK